MHLEVIYDQLEIFTAPSPQFEHALNPACKQCSKCTLCMEEGGKTFVERCQTEAFKAHLWRIPNEDGGYHYEVEYIFDPQANPLPYNYMVSYQRHLQLRKAFSLLEPQPQEEFTGHLAKGSENKYWRILDEKEALDHRKLPNQGLQGRHYLPASFVLKTHGSTCARLVLDP